MTIFYCVILEEKNLIQIIRMYVYIKYGFIVLANLYGEGGFFWN